LQLSDYVSLVALVISAFSLWVSFARYRVTSRETDIVLLRERKTSRLPSGQLLNLAFRSLPRHPLTFGRIFVRAFRKDIPLSICFNSTRLDDEFHLFTWSIDYPITLVFSNRGSRNGSIIPKYNKLVMVHCDQMAVFDDLPDCSTPVDLAPGSTYVLTTRLSVYPNQLRSLDFRPLALVTLRIAYTRTTGKGFERRYETVNAIVMDIARDKVRSQD